MRRNQHNVSVRGESASQSGEEVRATIPGAVLQRNTLTPAFYELISKADPDAANDDYYVTSPEFIQLHSKIKKDFIRGLSLWAVALCLFMASLAYVYQ